jgi:RNA polymerase sigma-70 factor (sigma-E family)
MDFSDFYLAYRDKCFKAVLASTGDRYIAEEMVAEAFARAWSMWEKVSRHPSPQAWVMRTALNANVSSWRKRRREVPLDIRQMPDGSSAEPGGAWPGEIGAMNALARLPERQRQVIALRIFLDLDTAATAQVLGIAPGTVTAHLSRALSALRQDLMPADQQETQK